MEDALVNFGKSLKMHPQYEKARSWRDRVKNELSAESNAPATSGSTTTTTSSGQVQMNVNGQRVVVSGDVEITSLEDVVPEDGIGGSNTDGATATATAVATACTAVPSDTVAAGDSGGAAAGSGESSSDAAPPAAPPNTKKEGTGAAAPEASS